MSQSLVSNLKRLTKGKRRQTRILVLELGKQCTGMASIVVRTDSNRHSHLTSITRMDQRTALHTYPSTIL